MLDIEFIQISTGSYTYVNNEGITLQSHCIYGLDDEGNIWKWQVKAKEWILLKDTGKYDTN